MRKVIQYYSDLLKFILYSKLSGEEKKLKTGMQSVLLLLRSKDLLPKKIRALEMFGMHGLWHTMDYVHLVEHLDIFELDKKFSDLSKKNLPKNKTNFFSEDSIKWISSSNKTYNFIVADIPYSGTFYNELGLPLFFNDMLKVTEKNGILIFNCHTKILSDPLFENNIRTLNNTEKTISQILLVPKNSLVTYVILSI